MPYAEPAHSEHMPQLPKDLARDMYETAKQQDAKYKKIMSELKK